MFAMVFEKDPLQVQDIPGGIVAWVQNAGGWAAFGVFLWLLLGYTRMREVDRARIPHWQRLVFLAGTVGAFVCYLPVILAYGFVIVAGWFGGSIEFSPAVQSFFSICLTVGGAGALLAAGLPFAVSFATLRFRRIWALTKLSFKEAIRNRVLYGFSALLLVFLFGSWFIPHKPEDQVRSYVGVVYWVMKILLLVTAIILAAFSIPTDIRKQTIHTIVTKPVERFEILLGRFLGFTGLMTLVLLLMTTVSVVYVLRGIDPAAAAESLKAREPLYGDLRYENTSSDRAGTNVGREWDYRSYITVSPPNQPMQYAVWDFPSVPRSLGDRKQVRCEFTFDIYRTTKGFENRGVSCEFEFQTAHYDRNQRDRYVQERSHRLAQPNRPSDAEIDDQLAEEFGYYVVPAKDITDYHTMFVEVPGGLFRNALKSQPAPSRSARGETIPPLQVRVSVSRQSVSQYVGMARYDLYWRLDDPHGGNEKAAFTFNFYKGAFGLWLRLCLVIGLSVALSTYLSGVISMLVAGMLYLGGGATQYIQSIGQGTAAGGGPMEALVRLANRQVALVPLEDSTAKTVATSSDVIFRWFIRRILDIIPDVDRYDLTTYVGEGFNIPATQLLLDWGLLALYLLPWIVLAYYLMKWREIAAPT
jgi:ABC-type transport system involved in multi-copper enzyme maturation permease subunit